MARIKRGAVAWGAVEPAWTEEGGWGQTRYEAPGQRRKGRLRRLYRMRGWYYGSARGNTGGCGWPGGEGILPFQPRKTAFVRAPVIFAVAAGYQVIDIRTEFGDFAFGYRIVGYIDDIGCDFL